MAKIKTKYVCQECGYETSKWLGRCPECTKWNTLVEEIEQKGSNKDVFIIDKSVGYEKSKRDHGGIICFGAAVRCLFCLGGGSRRGNPSHNVDRGKGNFSGNPASPCNGSGRCDSYYNYFLYNRAFSKTVSL